jgi:tetratricopeptide (TPR) repeat protein
MPKKGRRSDYTYERNPGAGYNVSSMPRRALAELEEAEDLIHDKRYSEALDMLESLDRRYPKRDEILRTLVNLYLDLNDMKGYLSAMRDLSEIAPHDADVQLGLAGAYMTNVFPAHAAQQFKHFLRKFPDDERANDARDTLAELEGHLSNALDDNDLKGDAALELATLHEEVQVRMAQGRLAEAERVAEQLLRRKPDFVSGWNNLGSIHYMNGNTEKAIECSQRVLAIRPDNIHALSNLTRYLLIAGDEEGAKQTAERLRPLTPIVAEHSIKKAEAFTFLGDDQAVLDAYAEAQANLPVDNAGKALLMHLAAVAHARTGHEKEARDLWKRALAVSPTLDLARDNLNDLKLPVEERHTPYAFDMNYWLNQRVGKDLSSEITRAEREAAQRDDELDGEEDDGDSDSVMRRATQRTLRKHPNLVVLAPHLLDRSGPAGRQFALIVAKTARTPEMLNALRDFGLSQRGPDRMRTEAVFTCVEAGVLPPNNLRMWLRGEWREINTFKTEITGETDEGILLPEVEPLAQQAHDAMHSGDSERAEELWLQALEIQPDVPMLRFNLAQAYELQGRRDEAQKIIEDLHRQYPDYLFARCALAIRHAEKGEIAAAREMVTPLSSRTKLHVSEHFSLMHAQFEIALAEGKQADAEHLLDIIEEIHPDHPSLEALRRRLNMPKLLRRFLDSRR